MNTLKLLLVTALTLASSSSFATGGDTKSESFSVSLSIPAGSFSVAPVGQNSWPTSVALGYSSGNAQSDTYNLSLNVNDYAGGFYAQLTNSATLTSSSNEQIPLTITMTAAGGSLVTLSQTSQQIVASDSDATTERSTTVDFSMVTASAVDIDSDGLVGSFSGTVGLLFSDVL